MRRRINRYFVARIFLPSIPLLFLFIFPVNAQYNENEIKAVYIEKITRFVEWPLKQNTFSGEKFIIGVFGETDFYNTLMQVFEEKLIKDHKVTIILIKNPKEINACDLCYISERAKPLIPKFVVTANSSGVLLISGTTGFCEAGVHINFYIEDEKLKFEINEKSIDSAGFKVSYLLMQNIRIIK